MSPFSRKTGIKATRQHPEESAKIGGLQWVELVSQIIFETQLNSVAFCWFKTPTFQLGYHLTILKQGRHFFHSKFRKFTIEPYGKILKFGVKKVSPSFGTPLLKKWRLNRKGLNIFSPIMRRSLSSHQLFSLRRSMLTLTDKVFWCQNKRSVLNWIMNGLMQLWIWVFTYFSWIHLVFVSFLTGGFLLLLTCPAVWLFHIWHHSDNLTSFWTFWHLFDSLTSFWHPYQLVTKTNSVRHRAIFNHFEHDQCQ